MTTIVYDDAAFRAMFAPAFSDTTLYPESQLANFFSRATSYISPEDYGFLQSADRTQALYLMAAHLQALSTMIAQNNGASGGFVTQATIDKVSVTLQAPPAKSQWQWWLNMTPWGQQLLALLGVASAGGWLVGGLPERAAFRRVGGGFGGRLRF